MSDLPNQPQNTLSQQPSTQPPGTASAPISPHANKEVDAPPQTEAVPFSEMKTDVEVSKELERYMQPTRETIDLPIDLKQMGMSATGPAQPVVQAPVVAPAIKLPLADEAIERGLHAPIMASIRWLAEFCLKQLKKAHYHLKRLAGGQVVREADAK